MVVQVPTDEPDSKWQAIADEATLEIKDAEYGDLLGSLTKKAGIASKYFKTRKAPRRTKDYSVRIAHQDARPHLQMAIELYELLNDNDGRAPLGWAAMRFAQKEMRVTHCDIWPLLVSFGCTPYY